MNFTAETDAKFSEKFIDISKTEKRLVRVASKHYERTGNYIFLKVFKKNQTGEFTVCQRLTLTAEEFDKLASNAEQIKNLRKN